MPLSRDDYIDAMRSVVEMGHEAWKLTRLAKWQRASLEGSRSLDVLAKVVSVGYDAQDVLEQMEENDAR